MNSVKIWMICVSISLVIATLMWLWFNASFVTQPMENVEKIVILIEPYHGGKSSEINIVDQLEIECVYELLKETKVSCVNRYPKHSSSLQFDPKFNIQIEYRNGKTDRYSAASASSIFRRLNTVTSHGDQGYIMGSSKALWEYVLDLSTQ